MSSTPVFDELAYQRWVYQFLRVERRIKLVCGESVLVSLLGPINTSDGPDFLSARLVRGGEVFAGAVELHLDVQDWYRHKHHRDPRYDAVILHMVHGPTEEPTVRRADGTDVVNAVLTIPASSLEEYRGRSNIESPLIGQWQRCWHQARSIMQAKRRPWVLHLAWMRLTQQHRRLMQQLVRVRDPEQALFVQTARALGYRQNTHPMEQLASRAPLALLQQLPSDDDVHATLLGTAGWLPTVGELQGTHRGLQDPLVGLIWRYLRLRETHLSAPMTRMEWNTKSVRPNGRPFIRILQLSSIVAAHKEASEGIWSQLQGLCSRGAPLSEWRSLLSHPSRIIGLIPDGTRLQLGEDRINAILYHEYLPVLVEPDDPPTRGANRSIIALLEGSPPEGWSRDTPLLAQTGLESVALVMLRTICDGTHQLPCTDCPLARYGSKRP